MIDYAKITVKAGNGGAGAVSFQLQKGRPYGPPDGGDGGKGGNVYMVTDPSKNTLVDFNYQKMFSAGSGEKGGKNNRTGASSEDLYIKVPVGTVVEDLSNKEKYDLDKEGKSVLIAQGGIGGHGNARFKSMRVDKRSNEYWEAVHSSGSGGLGEEINLVLELKLLADVGLVGLPNAGKSTLLSVLTEAKPKIADYPFTTLEPYLGVMKRGRSTLVVADIPGLIEGAALGKGLGIQFLKHIERTKLLIQLISAENEDKISAYRVISKELQSFSKDLAKKPKVVVLNKIDILSDSEIESIINTFKSKRVKIIPISAATGQGLENLQKEILKRFKKN